MSLSYLKRIFLLLVLLSFSYGNYAFSDNSALINEVSRKLVGEIDPLSINGDWPPSIEIINVNGLNAFARNNPGNNGYIVGITQGLLDSIIAGNPSRLAYVLGHELSHITLGHLERGRSNSQNLLETEFSRQDEFDADLHGMQLALQAGYSFSEVVNTLRLFRKIAGDYSPLEALSTDHPSWTERLEKIDNNNEILWRSMSSFESGVQFLLFENYDPAIVCFNKVLDEFPNCYEAYANLGYAYLMRFMDNLDLDDVKAYNIGHLVVGGFYRRPASIESPIRGIDENIWWKAISNFREALRIKNDLALVKSYLGIAYYLDPRQQSLEISEKYIDEALKLVTEDQSLDPLLKAVVYLNSGAVDLAVQNYSKFEDKVQVIEGFQHDMTRINFKGSYLMRSFAYENNFEYALMFNQVLMEYHRNSNKVVNFSSEQKILDYLKSTSPSSVWWNYAYDIYSSFNNKNAKYTKKQLIDNYHKPIPNVNSVLVDNEPIFLSQEIKDAILLLGDYDITPLVEERKLNLYKFTASNVELIASGEILAIILNHENSPKINIRCPDEQDYSIKIGMTRQELENNLDFITFSSAKIPGKNEKYYLSQELGLAFAFEGNRIKEIIIVTPPIRSSII